METAERTGVELVDLATTPLRELNRRLHELPGATKSWRIVNPNGAHAIACGLDADIDVEIQGHVGYYCAGMNKLATVRVHGNAGPGLAENLMSGAVLVDGSASQSAGASGHGGLLAVPSQKRGAPNGLRFFGDDFAVFPNIGRGAVHAGGLAGDLDGAAQRAPNSGGEFLARLQSSRGFLFHCNLETLNC